MNILILGASSLIGRALALSFARSNVLILAGRSAEGLGIAAEKCEKAGASETVIIQQDFALGVNAVLSGINGMRIDLLIDAASASSRYRDCEIGPDDFSNLISADLLSHMAIVSYIVRNQSAPLAIVFVSTILALVRSPGRAIYAGLKSLYESYLTKVVDNRPSSSLMIVYVGSVIDKSKETKKLEDLASAVLDGFNQKKRKLIFGPSGVFLLALYNMQPVLFAWFMIGQRIVRKVFNRS